MATPTELKKSSKYKGLAKTHHMASLAIEISGIFGPEAQVFFTELGRHMIQITGDSLAQCHVVQQIQLPCKEAMLPQ